MKILVISLADASSRRRSVCEQFATLGIDFEFLDAAPGFDGMRQGGIRNLDALAFLLNTGRNVTPGEVGCFASHRLAWQRCVELGEPVVIMEDDFSLRPNFRDALNTSRSITERVGFLRLQDTLRSKEVVVAKLGRFELQRFTKPPHGLMCYCLSPDTAKNFLARTVTIDAPVDVFVKLFWEHGQPMYGLTPFSVESSELHSQTSIEGRSKAKKPIAISVWRLLRRLQTFFARTLSNARRYRADRQCRSSIPRQRTEPHPERNPSSP